MNDKRKYIAELIGTFALVLFGCGSAVIAGDKIGFLGSPSHLVWLCWLWLMLLAAYPGVILTRR